MMSLQPTFEGFVKDTENALTLIQAVIDGVLQPVPRRPDEGERDSLIRSGNVFIIDEQASGVQRWTDGVKWSPSRILGNFLLYRQQRESNTMSSSSSAASSASSVSGGGGGGGGVSTINDLGPQRLGHPSMHSIPLTPSRSPHMYMGNGQVMNGIHNRPHNDESSLLGSLIDPGKYDEDGLMKKTISVPYRGTNYRLISYYRPSDVRNGRLVEPMRQLPNVQISPELEEKKPFRGREIEIPDYTGPMPSHMEHAYPSYSQGVASGPDYGLYPVFRGSYQQEGDWSGENRGSEPVQIPLRQDYASNLYTDPVINGAGQPNEASFRGIHHHSHSHSHAQVAGGGEALTQHQQGHHDHDHLIADVFKSPQTSPDSPTEHGSVYEYSSHDTNQQLYYSPPNAYSDYSNHGSGVVQPPVPVAPDGVINHEIAAARPGPRVPWNGY